MNVAAQALAIAAGSRTDLEISVSSSGLSFQIPLEDTDEFHDLVEARRNEVLQTLRLLERIHCAKNFVAATRDVAASFGNRKGYRAGTLRAAYYRFAGSVSAQYPQGDWRVLVRNYKAPSQQPREFVEFVKRLAEENNRSMKAAWRKLLTQIWPSGQVVPGYGTWMEWFAATYPREPLPKHCPRDVFPVGWSKRNLYRYKPCEGDLALVRQGFKAAKKHFPHVPRDTSRLRPMELLVIDDFETDNYCVFPGDAIARIKPQVCRVGGLLAIDVATRRKLAFGLKPRLQREDGTHMAIGDDDVASLLHDVFRRHGLPEYTITILCENRTARISPDKELSLVSLFDGRIRIERTGLIEHRTLANGFVEGGGKPWQKGWIESEFNYLWNESATLPGYKGSNERLNGPGDLDAKIAYAEGLLAKLTPEVAARLRLPFMNVVEAVEAFSRVFERADHRTEHRFIGFDEVTMFRLGAHESPRPFAEMALLAPEQMTAAEIVMRRESPVERWTRLSAAHPRHQIDEALLAILLLTPKKDLVYRNRAVSFAHGKAGFSYIDPEGRMERFAEGTKFLGYFDVANPLHLHLCDEKGKFLGFSLRRLGGETGGIDVRDKAALRAEGDVTRGIQERAIAAVRERHAVADAQLAADRAHNQAIVEAHAPQLPNGNNAAALVQGVAQAATQQADEQRRARTTRTRRTLTELVEDEAVEAPAAAPRSLADLINPAD